MKFLTMAVIGILLLIAILTNPGTAQHRDAVKSKIAAGLQTAAAEQDPAQEGRGNLGMQLGMLMGNSLIGGLVDNMVTADNYLACSFTRITYGQESRIIGIGLFGNVFITQKVDEAFKGN